MKQETVEQLLKIIYTEKDKEALAIFFLEQATQILRELNKDSKE